MKKIIVIYHKNCPDGMTSAAIAHKVLGDDAEFIPCSDRQVPPTYLLNHEDKKNTTVYILDFSYPIEVLKEIERDFKEVIILDHHASVKDDVLSISGGHYDADNCAAHMSYKFFNKTKSVPSFIELIDIIDLHKDERHQLDDIISYINSVDFTLENYTELIDNYDNKKDHYTKLGAAINQYVTLLEKMAIDNFDTVEFEGYTIPAVNICFDINTKSRILAKLYEIMPPMAMSYRYDEGQWKVSLRGNGSIDVSALAAKYGGGGHKGSAGFVVKADGPLPFAKHIFKI